MSNLMLVSDLSTKMMPPVYRLIAKQFSDGEVQMRTDYHKVKIINERFLYMEFVQELYVNDELFGTVPVKVQMPFMMHEDLMAAFSALTAHYIFINDLLPIECYQDLQSNVIDGWIENKGIPDQRPATPFELRYLSRVTISGVKFSGFDENAGVSIMGTKLNNIGKFSSINTPLAKLEDPEDMYLFQSDLKDAVDVLKRELDLYLYGGKCTASLCTQTEIEFED